MAEFRLPPQNLEAEQSVLGALLIDKDAIVKVAGTLRPEHFYKDTHAEIYRGIIALYERQEPSDMITLPTELKKKKALKRIGGTGYLAELANMVPTSAHIEHYAGLVKDTYTKRQLIFTASKIVEMGYKEEQEVPELLDRAESSLFGVAQEHLHQLFLPLKRILEESFDKLDNLRKKGGRVRGVSTGFRMLDDKLSGLQASNLIILAARPSLGKSSLAANIAQYVAVQQKIPVGFFSLEMSGEQLADRMLSAQADVDAWRIVTGNLSDEDFAKLNQAYADLSEAPIFVDDTPGLGVLEMRTKARRLQMEQGVQLIILDYLQLAHSRKLENRVQEVSEISQALKNLARELKIPVLALSQLSRAVEMRGGAKRPQLSDLRESGSIEQDADVVMFLYRDNDEDKQAMKLLIAKHRNGPTGEIDLFFRGERTRFYEVEKERE